MTGGRTTRALAVGLYAGLLLVLLATVAWATGRPFVFPSLGPSAYALATDGEGRLSARRVIGGHAVGVVAGLVAYHLLAPGLSLASLPPAHSTDALRLAASGTLSVALTAAGMVGTRTDHAPAAATTLIVSLGLLADPVDGAVILVAVFVLFLTDRTASHGPADPGWSVRDS
ncbi:HPP family protein [Halobacteriales archaeon QS_1_68_20]|nr:MAG: HPP family protein [Halobacteriales archaeon QS_1_68_20]